MRILMVSQMTPYLPCHDGFRALASHLLENLARRHDVALIAAAGPGETPEQQRWASPLCASVVSVPVTRWARPWSSAPAEGIEALRLAIAREVDRFDADVLHLEGGALAPLARAHGLPTVLALHDSRALRAREFRRLARTPWDWVRAYADERVQSAWEARWSGVADACVVLSEEDRAALARAGHGRSTVVIPNGVDIRHYEFRRAGQPGRMVFAGNLSWPPNIDAACRFARAILPRIRALWPRAEFVVAGANPTREVRALARLDGVRVTGTVPDLRPTIWSAAVSVSPLRAGFGMKNKILEAMALGTPIVASARSLSGLIDVVPAEHLLVADDDEATADAVLRLLTDEVFAAGMARRARTLVETVYSWPAVGRHYEALLARVAGTAMEATA